MKYETSSAKDVLIFNGKGSHVVNPWHITIDTDEETVGGTASVFCLSKGDARKIKEILLEFNANGTGTTINVV
jgi:hypothetical protein